MEITTEEYRVLFNAVTDAIMQLEQIRDRMVIAQQHAEEMIISSSNNSQSINLSGE